MKNKGNGQIRSMAMAKQREQQIHDTMVSATVKSGLKVTSHQLQLTWICPGRNLFSIGNGSMFSLSVNMDTGSFGLDTVRSTRRYSTGSGRPRRVTSFPYSSFS